MAIIYARLYKIDMMLQLKDITKFVFTIPQ